MAEREYYSRGGGFSFNMAGPGAGGPAHVGQGTLTDLYTTPGHSAAKDDHMFTQMHLRGLPKPKKNVGPNGTRADGMDHEGFRFSLQDGPPRKEQIRVKLGGAELYDTQFDESLPNDSQGFGQKQMMHPLYVRAQSKHSQVASMRMIGGLDDV